MYQLVLEFQIHATNSIRAEDSLKVADAYARDIITNRLEIGCYDYGLGHGIGTTVHEKPRLHYNSQDYLKENTAVSVESGIYIKGWGGIRIEDVIIVGKDGNRNLTTAPKELIILK